MFIHNEPEKDSRPPYIKKLEAAIRHYLMSGIIQDALDSEQNIDLRYNLNGTTKEQPLYINISKQLNDLRKLYLKSERPAIYEKISKLKDSERDLVLRLNRNAERFKDNPNYEDLEKNNKTLLKMVTKLNGELMKLNEQIEAKLYENRIKRDPNT